MIETIRRLLDFSGRCRTDLLCAFGYGVLYSVSEVIPVLAIVVALEAVLSPSGGGWFAVAASGGLMGLSVAGKIVFGKRATERRMLASYDMCADKRIEVGEILKRVPLGYFSQNRLGELTATLTTTLGEIETNAVAILDKVANGFVHAVAITLLISWYDWHAGLITAAGLVVSLFVYGAMQRKGRKLSPVRQAAQSRLVAAVLEYVQGMAVVKAFGLGDRSNRAVDEAIEACRASNTDLERSFSTLAAVYQLVFKVAAFGVLLSSGLLYLSGDMDLIKCLLLMVSSFMLYAHIEMMGSVSALSRVISVALDRMEALKNAPLLDERGEEFVPESFDIRMEDVVFSYDGTRLLEGINLVIPQGTTTAIVGPSGSGKTTLMNMIAGIYFPDEGEIYVGDKAATIRSPRDALDLGIGMIHQHFKLVDVFSATENIALSMGSGEKFDLKKVHDKARAICEKYEFALDLDQKVYEMSVSQKQTLEIVKVLYRGADILILDEPTAVLTPQETEKLFSVIRNMKADGKAVIIITHKLHEVLSISDRVAILRKGEYVGDIATKDANEAKLTEMMVGEKVELNIERPEPVNPVKRLDIEHLTVRSAEGITVLDDASFPVYGGEILGIAGISGNGQKELLEAIAGLQPAESGASIEYYAPDAAAPVQLVGKSPKAIREAGIHLSFVPEDRLGMGLVGSMGMTDNMMLKSYGKGHSPIVDRKAPLALAETIKKELGVVTPDLNTPVSRLSGGNVQKVLVGRELAADPIVLMTAYAVRGLDINTSYTIYHLLNEQKKRGVAVIYVGEDLDVLLELCDRIVVLCGGKVNGILDGRKTTKEEVGLRMTNLVKEEQA